MADSANHSANDSVVLKPIDIKIIAAKADNPDASTREIGKAVGVSHTCVQYRLRRLNESEAFKQIREGIADLIPKASEIVRKTLELEDDNSLRYAAARDLLKGMGLYVDRSKQEQSSIPVTPEQLVDAIFALDDDSYAQFRAVFDDRLRAVQPDDTGAAVDAESAVAGQDPAPDTQVRPA